MTLRKRLYIAALLVIILFVSLSVLLVNSFEKSEIRQTDQQLIAEFANQVITAAITPSFAGGRVDLFMPVDLGLRVSEFYVATVFDGKQQVIYTSYVSPHQTPQIPFVHSEDDAVLLKFTTVGSRRGNTKWRATYVQYTATEGAIIAMPLSVENSDISHFRIATVLADVVAVLVILGVGFWTDRLALRPIATMADIADRVASGEHFRRVSANRPDTEAGRLASAFNVMLDEQETIEERLRQFVADASHELRTPLSVIQGLADLWRQGELR